MGRVMYLDCFSGVAGDMVLAALLDAGLPRDVLDAALGSLGVDHRLEVSRVSRAGLAATHLQVSERGESKGGAASHHHGSDQHQHRHDHEHGEAHGHGSGHRSVAEIVALIERSALTAEGRAKAAAMFRRLAEAEAVVHGISVDQVHLHEVGATDSIVDVVGAVAALEWFGIDDIIASPLNVGSGSIRIAHGLFPVPAPATLGLLGGVPVYSSGIPHELVTPTGALLVSTYARAYGPLPAMVVERVGYGAGTRDLAGVPNVLRVVIGERRATEAPPPTGDVLRLECAIDDMNPQLFGSLADRLLAAGALDVVLTPAYMKKGRPGTLLTVLLPADHREQLTELIFRETTTIGVRYDVVERETLDRELVTVRTAGGPVRVKVARRRGEILNVAPEFDDCVRVADAAGLPVRVVQAQALEAWRRQMNSPGA